MAASLDDPVRRVKSAGWRRLVSDRSALIGVILLGLIVLFVLAAGLISTRVTGFTSQENHLRDKLAPPFAGDYLLGTDGNGRDVLTRLAFGGRISLLVAALASVFSLVFGGGIGLLSGYLGGWFDAISMHLVDLALSVPTLFLLIFISTVYDLGPVGLSFILAATSWWGLARLIRSEVRGLRHRPYIEAAVVTGASPGRIVRRHVLPNVLPFLLVAAISGIPGFIMAEAGLSFLGMGVRVPTPSWGNMLQEASSLYRQSWTVVLFPGLMIYLTTLSIYLVANGLRNLFAPRR